jgi:transposase InsO family protein
VGDDDGRLRDECLNVYSFESVAHAQAVIKAWGDDYNHRRPHGALGHLTPSEYAEQRQKPTSEAAALQLAPV